MEALKTAGLVVVALTAWGALAYVLSAPPKKPEPPAAWCWVGELGFGAPCKYRSRKIDV